MVAEGKALRVETPFPGLAGQALAVVRPLVLGEAPERWALAYAVPKDSVLAKAAAPVRQVVLAAVLCLLALALIVLPLLRAMVRPLRTATALAHRAATGDLAFSRKDFGGPRSDELGELADALSAIYPLGSGVSAGFPILPNELPNYGRSAGICAPTEAEGHPPGWPFCYGRRQARGRNVCCV